MSKKEKSGSAAVQSSAEKVKAQEPVVEPVVKEPSAEVPTSEVPADGPIMPGPLPMPDIRNSMLFDLFVANVSKVELRSNTRQTIENVSRWAFELSKVELEFFESKIKQENTDHE